MGNTYKARMLLILGLILMAVSISATVVFADDFAGGDGTEGNPYQISNKYQLDNIRNFPKANFVLVNDIIFKDSDFQKGGDFYNPEPLIDLWPAYNGEFNEKNANGPYKECGWVPIGEFSGSIDGGGYAIENLHLSRFIPDNEIPMGFIGENSGSIKNLFVRDCDYVAISYNTMHEGGICGINNGNIENCLVSGSVSIPYAFASAGGICGENNGLITGCINMASVSIEHDIPASGGIVCSNNGEISHCVNLGSVNGAGFGDIDGVSGAICSTNSKNGVIENSYAFCNMNSSSIFFESSRCCYAPVYCNDGKIRNVYSIVPSLNEPCPMGAGSLENVHYLSCKEAFQKEAYPLFDFTNEWTLDGHGIPYPKSNSIFKNRIGYVGKITEQIINVQAQPQSYKSINLTWNKIDGVKKYIVSYYVDNSDAKGNKTLAVLNSDQTSFTHEVQKNDINKYTYIVTPVWEMGDAELEGRASAPTWSYVVNTTNEGEYDTPADTCPPVLRDFLLLTNEVYSPGSIRAQISASDDLSGIKSVSVQFQDTHNADQRFIITKTLNGQKNINDVFTFSVTTGTPAGNYYAYRVQLEDTAGNKYWYSGPFYVTKEVVVKSEFDIEFTGNLSNVHIANELANMDEGKTVVLTIDDSSKGILRKECLDAIKGQDKTIIVYTDSSASLQWVFYGEDIKGETKDLDLNVKMDSVDGTEYAINGNILELIFADNGVLPGVVNFRLKADYLGSVFGQGDNVFLYHETGNAISLESSSCPVIKDGSKYWVYIDLTHNSKFLISGSEIAKLNITGLGDKVYTGKVIKPAITVMVNGKKLTKNNGYTVTYKNNKKIGKAQAIIKLKGSLSRSVTKTFNIVPNATKITKLSAGKKSFTVKYKKISKQVTGYQIQYSTSKNFKNGNKSVRIKSNKTISKKISKLKSKKTYYVRVRTYKTVNGVKYFSKWSSKKSIKVK